jgi:hypothetical protein
MLIVQFFDLLMLNIKYIPHTTQKTMATMARNFSSLTPRVGDVCDSMLFPCSGPFQWHNFYIIYLFIFCQGTCHNHPETTTKTSTSYLFKLMNYDYQKHAQPLDVRYPVIV